MTFKEAVEAAPHPVNQAYKPGIQALEGGHRSKVDCTDRRRLTGSLDLDKALAKEPGYANQPRWDYGIGYRPKNGAERAVWVEVHSATTSEVSKVLRKLKWLREWLTTEAEQLDKLTMAASAHRFVWVASGGIHITPHSRQAKLISQSALSKPRKHLSLP
ncbi:MAG: hypothetical protein OXJ53_20235 [Gammaproteobacteria bacterium]|nr:hypothetical protein [Gammaproteobacteria bacterium]MDE0273422.1 hypothetical protein [Gammaproteobacteria bacterium]